MKTQREKVQELLKSIETGAREPASYINPKKYIQHNLGVEDGIDGFGKILGELAKYPEPPMVNTLRIFEDGDYVFAHTEYNFFGPKVGFDIFRFEDGLIVEHWDNLREAVKDPNPSNRTLTDGATKLLDIDKTQSNKAFVRSFVEEVLIKRDADLIDRYFDGERYIQHNALVEDGVEAFKQVIMDRLPGSDNIMIIKHLYKVLGEGNFVLTVCEGLTGSGDGVLTAFYDLFRLEDDKIVEHWGISDIIPEKSLWQNDNGKFGFEEL